jgi:hypothetical protein
MNDAEGSCRLSTTQSIRTAPASARSSGTKGSTHPAFKTFSFSPTLGASEAQQFGSIMLYGFSKQPIRSLVPLARMWRHPPAVTRVDGVRSKGYDKAQRAFVLTKCTANEISFSLEASEDSPVVNPCLVLKGWDGESEAELIVNGQPIVAGKMFRQGIVYDTDGTPTKIVWLEFRRRRPVNVRILKRG